MTVTDEEVTPALFDHAKRVYEEMSKRCFKEYNLGGETGWQRLGSGETVDVMPQGVREAYEGHLTRLFSDLQIANPYYTKIRNALVAQGCIEQVRRGGGVAMSKWVLNYPPEENGFRAVTERKRPKKGANAALEQRVADLSKLATELYGQVDLLMDSFAALKARVDTMAKEAKK
jgi:hypothetical protein